MGGIFLLAIGAGYFALCYYLSKFAVRKIQAKWVKVLIGLLILSWMFLLPWVDGVWGSRNLNEICAMEAGTRISGKVTVAPDIFIDKKLPVKDRYGNVDWASLAPYVVRRANEVSVEFRMTRIQKITDSLVRVADGTEIVRQTGFYYRGGWLKFNGDGVGAANCMTGPALESILASVLEVGV